MNFQDELFKVIEFNKKIDCKLLIKDSNYLRLMSDIQSFLHDYNIEFNDLKLIGMGTYSDIYDLGNFIIKIGIFHQPDYLLKHNLIIPSLLKENYELHLEHSQIFLGLEIQPKAILPKYLSLEEVYQIYYQIRQVNYIWADPEASNIGIYNGKPVIIDTDFIYKENDPNLKMMNQLADLFENRYQEENK